MNAQRGRTVLLVLELRRWIRVGYYRHAPATLLPGNRQGTYFTCGWVYLVVDMNGWGKSHPSPTGVRTPNRPAHSESLYRLRYPGHRPNIKTKLNVTIIGRHCADLVLLALGKEPKVWIAKWGDLKRLIVQTAVYDIPPNASKVTTECQTQVHGTISASLLIFIKMQTVI